MPDINLVYRKSTTPTTNGVTAFKGSPLTNDELDNNFYGINVEMLTKAPINNAVFTGSTTIPNIIALGGTINGTVIGGTTPVAGTFTTLNTTGNLTVGDATGDILSVRAGTALLPALTTAGDLNTGMWFPAADTIAWSTNGAERLRLADTVATIANDLTVTGDVAVNGGDLTTTAATFNLLDTTATTLNLARAATAIVIGAITGTTTVRNNISVSGNGSVTGTLGVTGATTLSSTLGVTGNVAVNTNKFNVTAASGNTAIAGTLGVTGATTLSSTLGVAGDVAVNTNKFNVTAASGNTAIAGTLGVAGDVAVNTNKFNVTAASGNTAIAGTLGVAGATTLSSTLGVTGDVAVNTNKFNVTATTGNTAIAGTLGVAGDVAVNTNKFNVTATTGNTAIAGTLGVTGATTLSSTLGVTGDVAVATNKFTVASTTGNTVIAGTLSTAGNVAVNTNKFNVTATTGNTTIAGTLGVSGATTLSSTLGVTGDVAVNTNKFNVTAASGNTAIAGTLGVAGATTLSSTLGVSGASTLAALSATTGAFSSQVTSTVADGTAPFVVTSTTKVANLNADSVDGFTADQANTASAIVVRDASKNINISNAVMSGATSGTTTLQPAEISSTSVLTLPAATDTLVGKATTDTFTNKSVNLTSNTLTGTLTQFNTALSDADFVSIAGTETLTNKTLTSPTINTATISGGTIDNTPIGGTTRAAGAFTTISANSTLGVTGASTLAALSATTGSFSSQVTSTVADGTAPFVVTSTTKVANLNADRVDNITFTAPSATGSIPYVNGISGTDYTVAFSGAGSANTILSSTGSALEWISPSGLSAGTSLAAAHINSGNNGDLLYQYAVTVTVTTTIGSNVVSVPSVGTTGILVGQLIISGTVPGGAKVDSINTGANTITISENATATGAISAKFLSTSKLAIGTTGQVLIVGASAPAWSNNISVSGTVSHTGLVPTAGTNIDQVYSATDPALVVTTGWVDTSVNATELLAGSYMVQVSTGSGLTLEFHTGVMSWFSGDANTASGDEIILHRASAGSDASNLFLRVFRSATVTTDMVLQISGSSARTAASYTYKFRRML